MFIQLNCHQKDFKQSILLNYFQKFLKMFIQLNCHQKDFKQFIQLNYFQKDFKNFIQLDYFQKDLLTNSIIILQLNYYQLKFKYYFNQKALLLFIANYLQFKIKKNYLLQVVSLSHQITHQINWKVINYLLVQIKLLQVVRNYQNLQDYQKDCLFIVKSMYYYHQKFLIVLNFSIIKKNLQIILISQLYFIQIIVKIMCFIKVIQIFLNQYYLKNFETQIILSFIINYSKFKFINYLH